MYTISDYDINDKELVRLILIHKLLDLMGELEYLKKKYDSNTVKEIVKTFVLNQWNWIEQEIKNDTFSNSFVGEINQYEYLV